MCLFITGINIQFNQLIENIQYVNYRNYRDNIAIVKSTIDNLS